MKKLNEIPITVKICLTHSDYTDGGWPTCEIRWNNTTVKRFEANEDTVEFKITQQSDVQENTLEFFHYGINHHKDTKWVEIKKIFINNIDLQHLIWDSVQRAFIPCWDDHDSIMQGNLYLGFNGCITWSFSNPLLLDIQKRLGKTVQQIDGQETTREVLNEVKHYFFVEN